MGGLDVDSNAKLDDDDDDAETRCLGDVSMDEEAKSEDERESHHTLHYEESNPDASRKETVLDLKYCSVCKLGA